MRPIVIVIGLLIDFAIWFGLLVLFETLCRALWF